MHSAVRRILFFSCLVALFFAAGSSLKAYPVAITINATFSTIPGQPDPLTLGSQNPPLTATITTTVDSSAPQASYPVTVTLDIPGLTNSSASGTLVIGTNGTLTADFTNSLGSFSAVVALAGVTFPSPVPTAFGSATFSAPSSSVAYTALGASGTVGITGTITAYGLTASPSSGLTATYQIGGTAPAPQQISITSNDPANGAIPYTVTVVPSGTTGSTFLTLSSAGGTTPEQEMVSFSTSLAAGTYTNNIQINSGSVGTPITIPVTYTVTNGGGGGTPGFSASPSALTFNYTTGGTVPAAQTVALTSTTSTALSFTATSSVPWATVTVSGASTPATLTISLNSASLPTVTSSGTINVSGSGASLSIPITLNVTTSGGGGGTGSLTFSPASLSFQFYPPGTSASSQTVTVSSTGTAQTFTAVATGSFLSVSPASGTTPASVTVTVNPAGLSFGTYTGSIAFTTSTGTSTLQVTVNYGQGASGTTITVAPASLSFNYTQGQAVPPAQSLTVSAATPMHFTVKNFGFYLPVTPNSATTNTTVSVTLSPTGLGVGTYNYSLVFTPDSGTAVSIPVTVKVSAPVVVPVLTAAPASLTFAASVGAASPAAQTVAISAPAATAFTATTSVPWLTVSPSSGTTPTSLTVTANSSTLAAGTFTGNVTVLVGAATALTIPVTITVTNGPNLTFSPTAAAFAFQTGGTAPASQVITLTPGTSGLTYDVTAVGASWLSVAVSSDLKQATLTADPTGLAAGIYYGSIKVTGPGLTTSPLIIPVTLTVADTPTLGASPMTLTFSGQPGGAASAAQTIAVAGSDALPFTVTTDQDWLTVTPANGTSPATLSVVATPGALAAGQYSGTVTITSGGSTAQTIVIPVSFYLTTTAAPVISAITDGISYTHQAGAPGAIVAVWGQGLGPATPAPLQLANSTTVSTMAGGTQVFADGIACPILFSSSGQVNAVLPFALEGKTSTQVQLVYQGVASNTITLPVQAAVPGIFSLDATGQNGGAILNQDLSVNTASNPAPAGTIVAVYAGGAGALAPEASDGVITPVTTPFPTPVLPGTVTVAGQPATVAYYGAAPGLIAGVLQVNVTIPTGTPSGPQPIVLTVGSTASQTGLVVYVK